MIHRSLKAAVFLALLLALPSWSGAQWLEDGAAVVTQAYMQTNQEMIYDNDDGAFIVWDDWRNNAHYEIYMQRIDRYGNPLWTVGGVNVTGMLAVDQRYPAITNDGGTGALVCYQDDSMLNNNIKIQRVDSDGNVLWGLGGITVCAASGHQIYPAIAPDWYGGAYIAWVDERDLGTSGRDIYMQHIDSDGTPLWTVNGIMICSASNEQAYIEMIPDGQGGTIITWRDERYDSDGDIYAQKVNSTGVIQWDWNGVIVCQDLLSDQGAPLIDRDGFGGAVMTWEDSRGMGEVIYAQRISSAGTAQWTANGIAVSDIIELSEHPAITYDPWTYSTVITWSHHTTGNAYIRAQRLDRYGVADWAAGGAMITNAYGDEKFPAIIPDYYGGVYIAWQDDRHSQDDIFIQHVDEDGDLYWNSAGVPVATAPGLQGYIHMISDNTYSPLLCWQDYRILDNRGDIFAQRIDEHGFWGNPAPKITGADDVPNDDGLRFMLTWDRSRIDDFPEEEILYYMVLRSPTADYMFDTMTTIDAYQLENYSYTDTTALDNYVYYYMVTACSASPQVYWQSEVVTGMSFDDLSPAPPSMLAGEHNYEPEGILLTWAANEESDISGYSVYRGTGEEFVPGEDSRIGTTEAPEFLDDGWSWSGDYCYKVSAVDDGGNESGYALLSPGMLTGDDPMPLPDATFLAQNYPNPFNPNTTITFGLKSGGFVILNVYDAAGRLVAELINESRPAGQYATVWNGKSENGSPAASGVYFYKLIAGDFVQTRKMVLLR